MHKTPSHAIETTDLTRKFGDFTAVDALNLAIAEGKTFGLLGPNGAGKSTTIKMLTTLLPPTSGSALVAGCDITQNPSGVRRGIGYVPQMLSADGALTGRENLTLSARLYGMGKPLREQRMAEALAFMGIADVADNLVKTYSGGMIRRLELAQSLLHRPGILFLDEPTIGLDPLARRAVWERLVKLQKEYGITILLCTHDMEEADRLCDEIAIMHHGKIVALGKPAELKKSVGEDANLGDVFAHFAGEALNGCSGTAWKSVRQTRRTIGRLG